MVLNSTLPNSILVHYVLIHTIPFYSLPLYCNPLCFIQPYPNQLSPTRMQFYIREKEGDKTIFGGQALKKRLADLQATLVKENRGAKLFELDAFKVGP